MLHQRQLALTLLAYGSVCLCRDARSEAQDGDGREPFPHGRYTTADRAR